MVFEEFKGRAGDILSGTVRRFERSDVIIDLGKIEGIMPSRERVPTEEYQPGDCIRAYTLSVENAAHGPEIVLSPSHPHSPGNFSSWKSLGILSPRRAEIQGYRP